MLSKFIIRILQVIWDLKENCFNFQCKITVREFKNWSQLTFKGKGVPKTDLKLICGK